MQIRSGDVALKAFQPRWSDVVYAIRNHPSVRTHMRNAEPISRESHARWIQNNLIDARTVHLFVVWSRSDPVGIALLRNFRGDAAEIGVMLVNAGRRRLVGYKAAHLLGYYAFEVLDLKRVFSYVPRHNAHALAFNQRCGLESTGNDSDIYFELMLTQALSRSHETHKHFRKKYAIEVTLRDDDELADNVNILLESSKLPR